MIEPLIRYEPEAADFSLGVEALELSRRCGLVLDEEQTLVLSALLARRRDGKWSAMEVGLVEPRQNGKGGVIEARELAAIALVRSDRLIIHSAHEYPTAQEAFLRMQILLEIAGDVFSIRRVRTAHGEQGFDFMDGTRLRYRTRTKGGGRGFSADFLSLDEAMDLPENALAALFSTLSARENPQILYSGSAVDQETHINGRVLARVRERGIAGSASSFAYFEWSLPYGHPEEIPAEVLEDPAEWRKANPALGSRISEEFVRSELDAMTQRTFAVERLGVGDWPATDAEAGAVIKIARWNELQDPTSEIGEPICLAWDVSPDRQGAIAACGRNQDDRYHVEIVDARAGTDWIPDRLLGLARRHGPLVIAWDEKGPGASLSAEVLELLADHGYSEANDSIRLVSSTQNAQACGLLVDAVEQDDLRHLGDARLENAIRGAATRPLGDAFSFSRRSSSVNIAPLFAVTLALWAMAGCPDNEPMVIY